MDAADALGFSKIVGLPACSTLAPVRGRAKAKK
jgi:hypothetical protein